jgi:hypothetical protein
MMFFAAVSEPKSVFQNALRRNGWFARFGHNGSSRVRVRVALESITVNDVSVSRGVASG